MRVREEIEALESEFPMDPESSFVGEPVISRNDALAIATAADHKIRDLEDACKRYQEERDEIKQNEQFAWVCQGRLQEAHDKLFARIEALEQRLKAPERVSLSSSSRRDDAEAIPDAVKTDRGGVAVDDTSRCAICGWPLAASLEEGCVRGNCSHRPLPKRYYAAARARREYEPLTLPPEDWR